tara:strand:+ start:466 stop:594 length:129 start_codon:yes stop_codon:yes gene_type:complete
MHTNKDTLSILKGKVEFPRISNVLPINNINKKMATFMEFFGK